MVSIVKNITGWQAQVGAWVLIFTLSFLSNLQFDAAPQAITFAVIAVLYYTSIIYANAYWLIPRFYYRKKYILYALLLLCLLGIIVTTRTSAALYIYNTWFAAKPETLTANSYMYSVISALFIVLFSIFFRLALNYFTLSKKQGEIKAAQIQTELSLLKQQVHPHFLFNTLNNIYYVVVNESPGGAELIERLSGIMRYFIEESRKDKVLLKDEIDLLKSYIELEAIRMRYEMPVSFSINGNIDNVTVPPLMLLPLVENIFKHGVDKRSMNNFAELVLSITRHTLLFTTRNMFYTQTHEIQTSKTGLANLEKRLKLYYESGYVLTAGADGNFFTATLQIPLDEN